MTRDFAVDRAFFCLVVELACLGLMRLVPEMWLALATGAIGSVVMIAALAVAELLVLAGVLERR